MGSHRAFKDAVYAQFARIGHAVASPTRIEMLDLLGQRERTVADLAAETATPVKNASAHLRVLRQAGLVETRRQGAHVVYRLADQSVHDFVQRLGGLAHERFAEVQRVTRDYLDGRDALEPISARELRRRLREGNVTVIDVRPPQEYENGHIPGALSVPIDQIRRGRVTLPPGREVVAYCRGRYCVYAVDAVNALRQRGYRAVRVDDGLPGWRMAGGAVARGREA